jgi:hypothetical protein
MNETQDKGYENENDYEDDERVELYDNSYDSYLKNADNFIQWTAF